MEEKVDKLKLIKIKIFCLMKSADRKQRRQAIVWENTFSKDKSDKGLVSRTYK